MFLAGDICCAKTIFSLDSAETDQSAPLVETRYTSDKVPRLVDILQELQGKNESLVAIGPTISAAYLALEMDK